MCLPAVEQGGGDAAGRDTRLAQRLSMREALARLSSPAWQLEALLAITRILGAISPLPSVNTPFAHPEHNTTIGAGI